MVEEIDPAVVIKTETIEDLVGTREEMAIIEMEVTDLEEIIKEVDMVNKEKEDIDQEEMIKVEATSGGIMKDIVMGGIDQEEIMTISRGREAIAQEVTGMIRGREMVIIDQGGILTQIQITEKTQGHADHVPILTNSIEKEIA